MKKIISIFLIQISCVVFLSAKITLPEVITNNMVLQQGKQVSIWGETSPLAELTIYFGERTYTTKANQNGDWLIKLSPMKATSTPQEMKISSGSDTVLLKNILIGEVWLCSGQSNMEFPLDRKLYKYAAAKKGDDLGDIELKKEKDSRIRVLYVEKDRSPQLKTNGWVDSNDMIVHRASAIGYFFAKELLEQLDVPVGIISTSWGGTRIEPWTSPEAYLQSKKYKDIASTPNFEIDGTKAGYLFDSMIKPIIPYTLKGFLWYQGESNCMIHDSLHYAEKQKILIDSWRKHWGDKTLPFYFVQISPYAYSKRTKDKLRHGVDLLPYTWEAQENCLSFARTGMVVTTDLVDNVNDIHPSYKWEVGRRLSLWALAKDYKKEIIYSGPLYQKMKRKGNAIELSFRHTGSGLKTSDNQPLNWFTVAGDDKVFYPAEAIIIGNKILVSSPKVEKPVAVRFAWNELAQPNFFNEENLPASPFRTDNW